MIALVVLQQQCHERRPVHQPGPSSSARRLGCCCLGLQMHLPGLPAAARTQGRLRGGRDTIPTPGLRLLRRSFGHGVGRLPPAQPTPAPAPR